MGKVKIMKRKIVLQIVSMVSCFVMALGLCACRDSDNETQTADNTPTENTTDATSGDNEVVTYPVPDGYRLVWSDEFDEGVLDMTNWNYEVHMPGWVNHELQSYVINEENIYVKDGCLVIQPLQSGNRYTSGRINTKSKHDFTYGIIEARIKVPQGKGFLPAFWMMPTDEKTYGPWPSCGEIDIMEVLGAATKTTYSTIHYGTPHTMNQEKFRLSEGNFSEEFHVFRCEWLPGKITFSVDGVEFYTTDTWFTQKDGVAYDEFPAPFNRDFYIILNVAVGGDWPGDPNESTVFDERAAMYVDYVRVYQNDSISK